VGSLDAAGAPTLLRFANGAATAIGRDAGERVASMTATDADGTALGSSGAYAYDGAGLVQRIGGRAYSYDAALRLAGASVLPQATNASKRTPDDLAFAYDAFGNVTASTLPVAGDPLAGGAPAESYRYDAGRWRWLRTGRDGLARITLRDASGQPAADYEVDAATARPKLVREYVYAGGALAVERRYASDGTASEWYHHRDHLGSLRIVTDESGRKAEAHDWYPYGQEMASWTAAGATTRKLYTGHERDAETGLDYMLARYYASSAGAFLTVDPLDASAKAADPLSWNRYAYVRGNPLNRVDPTGEDDTAKQADTHGKPPETGDKESQEEQERDRRIERLFALRALLRNDLIGVILRQDSLHIGYCLAKNQGGKVDNEQKARVVVGEDGNLKADTTGCGPLRYTDSGADEGLVARSVCGRTIPPFFLFELHSHPPGASGVSKEDQTAANGVPCVEVSFSFTVGIYAAVPDGRDPVEVFRGPRWVDLVENKDCSDVPVEPAQTRFR